MRFCFRSFRLHDFSATSEASYQPDKRLIFQKGSTVSRLGDTNKSKRYSYHAEVEQINTYINTSQDVLQTMKSQSTGVGGDVRQLLAGALS